MTERQEDQRALLAYYSAGQLQWAGFTLVSSLALFTELAAWNAGFPFIHHLIIASLPATLVVIVLSLNSWNNWSRQLGISLDIEHPDNDAIRAILYKNREADKFSKTNTLGNLDKFYLWTVRERAKKEKSGKIRLFLWRPRLFLLELAGLVFVIALIISFVL